MKLESLISLGVPLAFLLMLLVESRAPARAYQPVSGWRFAGAGFFVLTLVVGSLTPLLLPLGWLQAHRLFDLSALGLWGIHIGLLATSFGGYWLHRAEHRFDWLWRASHRLHHSPVRVDMLGAFYSHPLEVVLKVTMSTLVSSFVLGLAPLAASAVGVVIAVLSLFQHWNIRTPRWLGYLIQRPESHAAHHERGVHARNYSELPLWDMLFGSFHNPRSFNGKVGLADSPRLRVMDMLLMRGD
jgi:sterol desaturase/sphingolipid hydroxylase (fatty acid hydroxylase superfamily)